ncbi:MAG: thioredoxin family protein [Sulfurovum sp.]|nr:thioredoxin family protein [Sulfurovum sp.]
MELNWENDYKKALVKAQKEKKMVYLFIGADNCRHCERFKKQTLSNTELIETMKEDYILLYMSRDQQKIPYKFDFDGAPRHYFLNAKGDIIANGQGSRELEGWYDILDEVDLLQDSAEED